ncbi:MAG: sterol desaturase family protein [Pirellulaceae bacterium]|nr:sterol desaturase family protein [Pirellulaceae bacterium]
MSPDRETVLPESAEDVAEQDRASRPEDLELRPRGKDARGRLFRSRFMENLTRVSPTVALCTYIPIALAFVVVNFWQGYVTNVLEASALFLGGMLSWTFFEYIVHRFVFHFITESKLIRTFHYYAHGVHHEFPRDHGRLFMPPAIALTVAAFVFALFYLIMGVRAFMFFPGFVIAYLLYAFLHYSIHRYRPPRMLKFLWRHHLQHHYRCPKLAFGVSSPFWDFVFRTLPPAGASDEALSRLPKARTGRPEDERSEDHC